MKMEQTECSETSEYKLQTPGYYPKESMQNYFLVFQLTLNAVTKISILATGPGKAAHQVQPYKEIISRLSSWYEDLQVYVTVVFAST